MRPEQVNKYKPSFWFV